MANEDLNHIFVSSSTYLKANEVPMRVLGLGREIYSRTCSYFG